MSDYLKELKNAIRSVYECESEHVQTVPVKVEYMRQIAWEGDVEVFNLTGHAKATTCYAWGYPKDVGKGWEITTVLNIPPVRTPMNAVIKFFSAKAVEGKRPPHWR